MWNNFYDGGKIMFWMYESERASITEIGKTCVFSQKIYLKKLRKKQKNLREKTRKKLNI